MNKKRLMLLLIPIFLIGLTITLIHYFPNQTSATTTHNVEKVNSEVDSDGNTIDTYNIYVYTDGANTKYNHVEATIVYNNVTLVSFEPQEGFSGTINKEDSQLSYSLTSNKEYTSSDGKVVYAIIKIKHIKNATTCNISFIPSAPSLVSTNDVSITKRALNETKTSEITTVNTLDKFYYEIKLTNNSIIPTDSLTLTDTIPSDFTILDAGGGTVSNNTITWNIDTLAVDEIKTYYVLVQVKEDENRTNFNIKNTASVTINGTTKSDDADVNILYSDISITKVASKTSVMNGEEYTYTITVKNNGTGTSKNIIVEDTLDSNLTFISSDTNYTQTNNKYTFNIGTLNANEEKIITITVLVNNNNSLDKINNVAIATEENKDPVEDEVTVTVLKPKLTISKVASVDEVKRGEEFTYTITVKNEGTGSALNVNVTDTLNSNLELVSLSEGSFTNNNFKVTYASLQPKETKTITLRVKAKTTANLGTVNNIAIATSDNYEDISDSDLVTIVDSNLSITKTASKTTLKPGEEFTYTITLKNSGTAATNPITLTDVIDSNLTIVNSSSATVNKNTLTWLIPSIGANETKTYTVTVKVNDNVANNTIIPNIATAKETNKDEISASVNVTVKKAILSITKVAYNNQNLKQIKLGEEFYYKITVANTGSIASDKITITDEINRYLTIIDADNGTINNQTITWTIPSLNPGDTQEFIVTVRLNQNATLNSIIPNTAKLTHNKEELEASDDITVTDSDVYIKKEASKKQIQPGEEFYYTIEIGNNGNETVSNLKLTDSLPDELTYLKYETLNSNIQANITNQNLTFNISSLAPQEKITLLVYVSSSNKSQRGDIINNKATITYNNKELSAEDDVIIIDTDISIKKESSVEYIQNDKEFYYTITVTNNGEISAKNLTVKDNLDPKIIVIDASNGTLNSNTITWNIDELAANTSVTYKIKVKIQNASNQEKIINTAIVSQPNHEDKSDEATVIVKVAKYSITKSVSKSTVKRGEEFEYYLTIKNENNLILDNLLINDILDEDLIVIDSNNANIIKNNLSWNISLNANEEKTITIKVKTTDNTKKDKITNKATATYDNEPLNSNEVIVNLIEVDNPQTGTIISYIAITLGSIASLAIFINIKKKRKFYKI